MNEEKQNQQHKKTTNKKNPTKIPQTNLLTDNFILSTL